jgi:hypothetical protein
VNSEALKYGLRWAFAIVVFGSGFYGIVLYDFALDDLTKGALISLMTLAAQFVFGEAIASSATRRQQTAFDSGMASGATTTTTMEPGTTTTTTEPAASTDIGG